MTNLTSEQLHILQGDYEAMAAEEYAAALEEYNQPDVPLYLQPEPLDDGIPF